MLLLICGAILHTTVLSKLAAILSVIWVATQWTRLIPLARLFVGIAAACFALCILLWPEAAPRLMTALVQGTGFAGLMMVLGLLRQPVKRAEVTREAAEYLLSFRPKHRYGSVLAGAQFMALMFNIGIIAMIGDLTQPTDGRDVRHDPARRAMVMAAMRGAALVSIWSPMSLGFAIVTAGVPTIDPMQLIAVAFGFTALLLILSGHFPLLPKAAQLPTEDVCKSETGSVLSLVKVLGASALLLMLTITLHRTLALSFTLSAVVVLPVFSLIWLALEPSRGVAYGERLRSALAALADLRSESALFLSANVIGAALSLVIQASPLWPLLSNGGFASLPTLILCLFAIPLAAALYLPNSIMVVLTAQVLGPTVLGQSHPLALGLTLCIGWALAICVNPISAMNLIVGRFCDVPASRVAHLWNVRFVAVTFVLAALLIGFVFQLGG
ncbi:MAG: hypothetical protein HWE33_00695 [Rhodobacteraceae bacterium]|uniref:hypothetical protein n=1 Tax=Celeribacter sp. HF31 TaxID=2721558 RepID=UPI00142F5A1A|nr:hypothetical protein [Celeribacter sp. HF31]NIY79844.1 hypothetical protein [Celeribacter sp. HF31]NVK44791.1 hypothetical protein [Paracoccaceae bacterium]